MLLTIGKVQLQIHKLTKTHTKSLMNTSLAVPRKNEKVIIF